jgi:rfaE bifunctional protein kinase chain/domain
MEKTIFISGIFNVLHPGHLRLISFAKSLGTKLIVAIESDRLAGSSAHVSEKFRLEGIQSNSLVNQSFIFDEPVGIIIERIRPDIVVKGKEYENSINIELESLKKYGGNLVFSSGESIFSSLDLINKEFQLSKIRTISMPNEYMKRHEIKKSNLTDIVNNFSKLNICVIGDLIVDEYITCEPLGMSQEDPTIVVTPLDNKKFLGGAGIVSAHAAAMGAKVKFFSVTGNDEAREFALSLLTTANVDSFLLVDYSRPTTLKQRYRAKGKSLLRVSYLHQSAISVEIQSELISAVEKNIKKFDLLVFSDFNYGCLPQPLVDRLTKIAKKNGVLLAADSQSSSQVGDISRFKDMDIITPTEREARISTKNREDGLIVMAEQLRIQANANNVFLKLGEEGMIIHVNNMKNSEWQTDKINALNSLPKDVAGAGDSLLITSAMSMACGGSIWEAACLGSLAAAVQVGRLGNIPITKEEIISEII